MLEGERNLITKAKNGESEAFGLVYDHYMPKIYRFVLVKVSRREEAEDITHQVFLKAWTAIGTYYSEGELPFSSWLYRIAKNTVIDHYRRERPTLNIDDHEGSDELITRPDLDNKIDLEEKTKKLLETIKSLKETEREVIMLRFVEDMPTKEVAEAIGKSEGAVKVIQHRALENLRRKLQKDA